MIKEIREEVKEEIERLENLREAYLKDNVAQWLSSQMRLNLQYAYGQLNILNRLKDLSQSKETMTKKENKK